MGLKPKILLLSLVILSGCAWPRIETRTGYQVPGQNIVVNAASKVDWLVIIGAVTIAFGVAAFLNGNTRGTSIIAAGIAIVAVSLIVTTYLSLFAQYHTLFVVALSILGVVSFFTFAHTAADYNCDGKTDWKDWLDMLLKRKPAEKG
jgi:hypothetical protein